MNIAKSRYFPPFDASHYPYCGIHKNSENILIFYYMELPQICDMHSIVTDEFKHKQELSSNPESPTSLFIF